MNKECLRPRINFINGILKPYLDRENLRDLDSFLEKKQDDIYGFVFEIHQGVDFMNKLITNNIDDHLTNIQAVKKNLHDHSLPLIPLFFTEDREAFTKAVSDLVVYMENVKTNNTTEIEKGNYSRLHIEALDAKHFVGTVIADLIPMIITRTDQFRFLDSDELCRAICEAMLIVNPQGQLIKLIHDQGWFTTEGDQFHPEIVRKAGELFKH